MYSTDEILVKETVKIFDPQKTPAEQGDGFVSMLIGGRFKPPSYEKMFNDWVNDKIVDLNYTFGEIVDTIEFKKTTECVGQGDYRSHIYVTGIVPYGAHSELRPDGTMEFILYKGRCELSENTLRRILEGTHRWMTY
jgi:hypothetical protein